MTVETKAVTQSWWATVLALLLLWELGKYVARRRQETTQVANNSVTS